MPQPFSLKQVTNHCIEHHFTHHTPLAHTIIIESSSSAFTVCGREFNLISRELMCSRRGIKFPARLILTGGTCMLMYQISKKREMMNIYSYVWPTDDGWLCWIVVVSGGLFYSRTFYKNSRLVIRLNERELILLVVVFFRTVLCFQVQGKWLFPPHTRDFCGVLFLATNNKDELWR